tara:strand:- start:1771 stop:1992 length:222 start_codon:yes stop_codon:yes gene_type:complete
MSVWRVKWIEKDGSVCCRFRGRKSDATSRARRAKKEGAENVTMEYITIPIGYRFDFIDWLNAQMQLLETEEVL